MNQSMSNQQGRAGGVGVWCWLHALRVMAAAIASLVFWVFGGLLFVLVGLVCVPFLPGGKSRAVGQWLLKGAFRTFWLVLRSFGVLRVEYRCLDKLRQSTGGLIVAPNHPALWDAVWIIARVEGLRCILKASLLHNPILVGGATLAGFIPNKPVHKMVQRAIEALRQGERLLLFPEGTRTRRKEGIVNPFHGGIGIIAAQSGAPVWPVFIETDSDYLSKGWPVWRVQLRRIHIRITVGEPLACDADESAQHFVKRLEETFVEALGKKG
jgi:1-acyl-sn-glycerol-3-phosphate acyltransferase